jgi:hypothetical protein
MLGHALPVIVAQGKRKTAQNRAKTDADSCAVKHLLFAVRSSCHGISGLRSMGWRLLIVDDAVARDGNRAGRSGRGLRPDLI